MNEIYWITRFGAIHGISIAITVIAGIIFTVCILGYMVNNDNDSPSRIKARQTFITFLKKSSIVLIIGLLGIVFVPTTREAYIIWGVGGSIDYLKSNPTAKKLPDKCIIALDKWVDSLSEEKTESEKKE